MRKKRQKNRCTKVRLPKNRELSKSYDKIQEAYARKLSADPMVEEFSMNVALELTEADLPGDIYLPDKEYTTDFLIKYIDGTLAVREAVFRRQLERSGATIELLQLSKAYWAAKGVMDWKILIEEEKPDEAG